MKIVVCDTGPILHLREAGLLNLLERAGKVAIPKGVGSELSEIDALVKTYKALDELFVE